MPEELRAVCAIAKLTRVLLQKREKPHLVSNSRHLPCTILWSGYPAGHARLWTCDLCRLTGLRELGNSVPTDFDESITISDHIVELLLVLVSCHVVSSNP